MDQEKPDKPKKESKKKKEGDKDKDKEKEEQKMKPKSSVPLPKLYVLSNLMSLTKFLSGASNLKMRFKKMLQNV